MRRHRPQRDTLDLVPLWRLRNFGCLLDVLAPMRPAALLFGLMSILLCPTAAEAANGCSRPSGAKLVTSTRTASVYAKTVADPRAPQTASASKVRYWGCARSAGVARRLVDTQPVGDGVSTTATRFRLGGRFVAFVVTSLDHYGGRQASVTAVDLGGRRGRQTTFVGDGQIGGPGGPERPLVVRALKVSTSGVVAWVVRSNLSYFGPQVDRLGTFAAGPSQRVLDTSAPGMLTHVVLQERILRWVSGGASRLTSLSPFWVPER